SIHPPTTTDIYTLSLHDALPILSLLFGLVFAAWITRRSGRRCFPATRSCRTSRLTSAGAGPRCAGRVSGINGQAGRAGRRPGSRSEEHTSELQSRFDLVCRLLLE